jgi:hypothetical protein
MDKGCLPFILGFAAILAIYGVLSQGESYGFEALIKVGVLILSMIIIWRAIIYFNDIKSN